VDQFRFRPRVDGLEDRHTPAASPAQIFADLRTVQADAQFMTFFNQHPEYMVNGTYQPFVAGMLGIVVERERAAAARLGEFVTALQANVAANPALAPTLNPAIQQFGLAQFQASTTAAVAQLDLNYLFDALGIGPGRPSSPPVVPPVVPPPSPPAPTVPPVTSVPADDAGMSDSFPDITNPAFRTLSNGLKIRDIQDGDPNGVEVQTGDEVEVYYTGWLASDGTVFDSRRSPADPASFTVTTGPGGVIAGFAQGLVGMKPGGIRQLVIPPELGYGSTGQGSIPPDATLVFEIKLISVTSPTT
jgi:hypothetical protein